VAGRSQKRCWAESPLARICEGDDFGCDDHPFKINGREKLRILSMIAAAVLTSAALVAPAQAQTVWKMPAAVAEGSVLYKNFVARFAENVETLTDGEIVFEPYGAGVIVPAFEVHQAVQSGVVEAGNTAPAYLVNLDPTNAIFGGMPGGLSAEGVIAWYYLGGGEDAFKKMRREKMGLHAMAVGFGSSEIFAHSNVPIESVEDLKGLKYRASGAFAAVLAELGAVPTVVPGGEIYTLLERKGVDAVEFSTPGTNLVEGFHRVAPHLVLPGVHQPTFIWEVVIKADRWDALDPKLQAKVEAAAKLTALESLPSFQFGDAKAMQEFRSSNVSIHTLDENTQAEIRRLGVAWATKQAEDLEAKGDSTMAEILKSHLDYQKLWSENSTYLVRD
jgi:TRAP-type mannitol/chloroaromatic compound transport system substrate-binding protein